MIGGTTGHGNPSLLIRFLRFPLTRAPSAPTCLRSCLEITTRCFCLPDNPLKLRQPCPDARIEKRYRSSSFWRCHERFKIYVAAVSFSIRSKPFFFAFPVARCSFDSRTRPKSNGNCVDSRRFYRNSFPFPTHFLPFSCSFLFSFFADRRSIEIVSVNLPAPCRRLNENTRNIHGVRSFL